jgi:hypothetical protein
MYLLNIVAYHTDSSVIVSQANISLVVINVIKFHGLVSAIRTPDMEKCVLNHVVRDAGVNTRQEGEELNVLHMTIWRVLHEQVLYSYHLQRVQSLMPADFPS